MKGTSEARVREALTKLNESMRLLIYKPPDDSRNPKPADFLVWFRHPRHTSDLAWSVSTGGFIEVKQTPNLKSWPTSQLRTTQRGMIRQAGRIGAPYLLVVWWPRQKRWSVSDAVKVLDELDSRGRVSFLYAELTSRFGVDVAGDGLLPGVLGAGLRGEIG